MSYIKECPICGSHRIVYDELHSSKIYIIGHVKCKECGLILPVHWARDVPGFCDRKDFDPFEKWNQRADECDRGELSKLADEFHICSILESSVGAANMFRDLFDRIRKAIGEES